MNPSKKQWVLSLCAGAFLVAAGGTAVWAMSDDGTRSASEIGLLVVGLIGLAVVLVSLVALMRGR